MRARASSALRLCTMPSNSGITSDMRRRTAMAYPMPEGTRALSSRTRHPSMLSRTRSKPITGARITSGGSSRPSGRQASHPVKTSSAMTPSRTMAAGPWTSRR